MREKEEKTSSWGETRDLLVGLCRRCRRSASHLLFAGIPATPNHPNYAIRLHPGSFPPQARELSLGFAVSLQGRRSVWKTADVPDVWTASAGLRRTLVAVGGGRRWADSQHI